MAAFVTEPQTFTAARDWLANKVNLPTGMTSRELSNQLPGEIRMQAFMSAKVAAAGVLERLRGEVEGIAAGKVGYGEARKRLTEFLHAQGYGIPMPGTGEDKAMGNLASTARLELILRQNVAMAHAIGQREVSEHPAVKDLYPNYKYVAVLDENTRDTHADLNGLVLPKDDPFWSTHFPPWEFNCRCIVIDTDEPVTGKTAGFAETAVRGPKAEDRGMPDDAAQTGVVTNGGRTLNLTPNASGFVFRSDPRAAFTAPDFERIRDPGIRDWVKAEWEKKAAALLEPFGGNSALKPAPFTQSGRDRRLESMPPKAMAVVDSEEAHNLTLKEERLVSIGRNGSVRDTIPGGVSRVDIHGPVGRRMEGAVVTHAHLSGAPFSMKDIQTACLLKFGELRANTPANGVYSMTAFSGNLSPSLLTNMRKDLARTYAGLKGVPPGEKAAWLHGQLIGLAKQYGFNYGYYRR